MGEALSIAVVEDDRDLNDLFAGWLKELQQPDRPIKVFQFFTKEDAERAFRRQRFDLISLDLTLGLDETAGVYLSRVASDNHQGSVIVVSGNSKPYPAVMTALGASHVLEKTGEGAIRKNDYLLPFYNKLNEKRSQEIVIDERRQMLFYRGKTINLTRIQMLIAHTVQSRGGKKVKNTEIISAVGRHMSDATISKHISDMHARIYEYFPDEHDAKLRKIESSGSGSEKGYLWVAE